MTEEEYLSDRLENQINWYDTKSIRNKRWYYSLQVIEIITAATIPFLINFMDSLSATKNIVGVMGIFIAIIASILGLFQFQEKWVEYRTTCESLKHAKFLYQAKAEPYNQDESFLLLVEHIEYLVSKENSNWSQYACSKKVRKN